MKYGIKESSGIVVMHKIVDSKLNDAMGGPPNQKFLNEAFIQQVEEDRVAQGLPKLRMSTDTKDNVPPMRKILDAERETFIEEEGEMDKTEVEISFNNSDVKIKYLEKWLNKVLGDSHAIKIAGALECSKAMAPLNSYEIDRYTLT